MFTGITSGLRRVADATIEAGVLRYVVDLDGLVEALVPGASVSIDGCCQTVVQVHGNAVTFEAMAETLRVTTLGQMREGYLVSVERSARVGDELGGHEVSGHITGRGRVAESHHVEGDVSLTIAGPASWRAYLFERGFVALCGSSLTVSSVRVGEGECLFSVHLIPETLKLTKLGQLKIGDEVNVELDPKTIAIVDTVERVLAERLKVS